MSSMDLEGIAALSAAGVAFIGIPASVIVGRWQMKAALSAAEATSAVGLAQAESAYRAALDAVRAEANAALRQWRRGIQREAYASFLLAANRVKEVSERFVLDNAEDLPAEDVRAGKAAADDALAALKAAQTIIELEGPEEVADPAAGMTEAADRIRYYLGKQAIYERAWGKLGRLSNDQAPGVSATAVELMQALADLNRLSSTNSSHPDASNGRDADGAQAPGHACRVARNALPPNAFDDEEFGALMEGWLRFPPMSDSSYSDATLRFNEAEERFVRAAKRELHGPVAF
ncbi:hypothetical protein [Streptomyces sp. NPDC002386]